MDNKEFIKKFIHFDDETDTSTGYVGIEQEPDYEEYVIKIVSQSIKTSYLTGRKKDDEMMFINDHIITGRYSEIEINCDILSRCLVKYPDIRLITQANNNLTLNGTYQSVRTVISKIIKKYQDFDNMRQHDTYSYCTTHININGAIPDDVILSCGEDGVAFGKNILLNIKHAYSKDIHKLNFDFKFDCNALDICLGADFNMGTHTYAYAGINLTEKCSITTLLLQVHPLFDYGHVNLDVELKSNNSMKSIFTFVLKPERNVWLASLKGMKHIWNDLVVADDHTSYDEMTEYVNGNRMKHPLNPENVAKFLEKHFNKGHFDVTVQN